MTRNHSDLPRQTIGFFVTGDLEVRTKSVFYACCLFPFLACIGIFIGDYITAQITPKAKASPVYVCSTASATVAAWNDPNFPVRQRFIKFRATGVCATDGTTGCYWTAYTRVYKSFGLGGYVQVYGGNHSSGNECGGSSFVDWTLDFATWGVGLYRVEVDVYDTIPLLNPTLLKSSNYAFTITY